MKISRYIMITLCVILSLGMISCEKKNPAGGKGSGTGSGNHGGGGNGGGTTSAVDYTLTTQADVDALGTIASLNTLIIEGTGITSLTSLNVTSVNTLIIRNTSITDLVLPSPMSVQTQLLIENNAALTAISEMGLQMVFGEIVIRNNTALTDISGFLGLTLFQGSRFTVEGNTALGEDKSDETEEYGFNVIKKLINDGIVPASKVTLSNNHPDAATNPNLIGQGSNTSGYYSYTISSDLAALDFEPNGTIIQDLTISGPQVTNEGLGLILEKITEVNGNIVIDGASINGTEHLFLRDPIDEKGGTEPGQGDGDYEPLKCNGGITLRNLSAYDFVYENQKFFNTNGFRQYTEINGDLILENIPYLIHWGAGTGFAQIKTIKGDLIVRNCGMQQMAFMSLERVEGDIIFDSNCEELYTGFWWNLATNLTYIGGDLIITNNDHVNGLGGYEKLEYIGGNVLIKGNGTAAGGIPGLGVTIPNQLSMDLVQGWITNGVVKGTVECYLSNESTPVQFQNN